MQKDSMQNRITALILLTLAFGLVSAAPTMTVSQNPTHYGDVVFINATAQMPQDKIEILLNGSVLVGPSEGKINYTVCITASCLLPGTYSFNAKDLDAQSISPTKYLIVEPALPTLGLQYRTAQYGNLDTITVVAPSANDSISIMVDGNSFYTGTGTFTYTLCDFQDNMNCLPAGVHNVSVFDNTENVGSANQTLTITSSSPQIFANKYTISYGELDKVSAIAPNGNDNMGLFFNGHQLASGTGNLTYVICSNNSTPCLAAGTYNISSYDRSQNAASANKTLVITPVYPTISITYLRVNYGTIDRINATAPSPNDSLSLYINNSNVYGGGSNIDYFICSNSTSGRCLTPGLYNISVYDSPENVYSRNVTVNVVAVKPTLNANQWSIDMNGSDTITSTAPFFGDQLALAIGNNTIATGSGYLTYSICSNGSFCPAPGRYNVTINDTTEGVTKMMQLDVINPNAPTTQNTTTTVPAAPAKKKGSNDLLYGIIFLVVVVIIAIFFFLSRRG